MRPRTHRRSGNSLDPRKAPRPGRTFLVTTLLVAGFLTGLLAVSHPTAAVLVGAVVVAGWLVGRTARDRLRRRRAARRTRTVCLPAGGPCVEV